MKKNYLVLLSAALLSFSGANAQQVITPQQAQTRIARLQKSGVNINANTLAANGLKPLNLKGARILGQRNANGAANVLNVKKAPGASTIITDQPAGTFHETDFRDGFYTYSFFGYIMGGNYTNGVGSYVLADDAIYLDNPLNGLATDTWLKLDKVDDENYVAHLPQAIYQANIGTADGSADSIATLYIQRVQLLDNNYKVDTAAVDGNTEAKFTYKNGILAYADSAYDASGYPSAALGLVDGDGNWYGYIEAATKVRPNPETKTTLPAGLTPKQYSLEYTNYDVVEYPSDPSNNQADTTSHKILTKVAIDGNDYYIQDPADTVTTHWIKGTYDAQKNAVVLKKQYIGVNKANNVHLWFVPATYAVAVDSSALSTYGYIEHYRAHAISDELDLAVDNDAQTLTSPEGTTFVINAAENRIYYLGLYDDAKFSPWEEVAAAPADPIFNRVTESFAGDYNYGYASISFNLPEVDVNGNLLDVNKAYYNVYTSDDTENPYALTEDEGYEYYTGDPINIPYTYSDGMDIAKSGETHYWYVYFDTQDIDSVGVQAFYTGGGQTNASHLVWYNLKAIHDAAGINSVDANNSGIKSVAYYDLSGRQVAAPKQAGIYVKETTYADGTKKGAKFIKK